MIDTEFLKELTEVPSVGTACGPVLNLLAGRFGPDYTRIQIADGFALFQRAEGSPEDLRIVFVTHVDEIGGCVYGPRPEGGFLTRVWGNEPRVFHAARLQAFDYLAAGADAAYPVRSALHLIDAEERLIVESERIRPFRSVWTFREETSFSGDRIEGKALDPRVTVYAAQEAVRALDHPAVGALFVMGEECAMDVARKAVTFLQRHAPALELIVNADVPGIRNIADGRLDLPAIRIFERHNFIDPEFGIRVADYLEGKGVEFHLSAARSGSQTILFCPLAPTLSIALPSDSVHLPRVGMSLRGAERCTALLQAIGESALAGAFAFGHPRMAG